jgi:hypothetical protein
MAISDWIRGLLGREAATTTLQSNSAGFADEEQRRTAGEHP